MIRPAIEPDLHFFQFVAQDYDRSFLFRNFAAYSTRVILTAALSAISLIRPEEEDRINTVVTAIMAIKDSIFIIISG
jgi:hypothetical protein